MSNQPSKSAGVEYAAVQGTELRISRVGLGTWAMGGWMWGGTNENDAIETIHAALDRGITLIDTAPAYGFGRSEEIVGKALAASGMRSRAVIATKVGLDWRDGNVFRNATRERILREIDDSLRRLRTDVVDIYQVHWPDPLVSIEETAEAMRSLYEQGTIRAIGVSNFSVAQIAAFRSVAPVHVVQSPYNLFERGIELDVLPYCRANGIAVLGYGALCRGLLSGRITERTKFGGDDLRLIDPKFRPPQLRQYLAAVDYLDLLAMHRYGKRIIHLAVRWMLDQGVTSALWGARNPDQLASLEAVSGWALDENVKAEIDRVLRERITTPFGPEFMAPPTRTPAAIESATA